jgi:hypothetical protein
MEHFIGRSMAQEFSRRPLAVEARVRAWVSPGGICGGHSGNGTGFFSSASVLLYQYHSTVDPFSYIIWGMNNRPVCGRSSET